MFETIKLYFDEKFDKAQKIYKKVAIANRFKIRPLLVPKDNGTRNAQSNKYTISINRGTLERCNTDTIAFILGHELAHWQLGHKSSTHPNEYAADALGWVYAEKAGYNMCVAKKFFTTIRGTPNHPNPKDRMKKLPLCSWEKKKK